MPPCGRPRPERSTALGGQIFAAAAVLDGAIRQGFRWLRRGGSCGCEWHERCDCNLAGGGLMLTDVPRTSDNFAEIRIIGVPAASCQGDECADQCTPFDPKAAPAFELLGTLTERPGAVPPQLVLEDLELSGSAQLEGNGGLAALARAPLRPGPVTIKLR